MFAQNPDVASVTVCDIDRKRLDKIKKAQPGVHLAEDFDKLLAGGTIDAVVGALPAALHYEAARKALAAGKHVLVEKPLASTAKEAEELCELAEREGRVLMVGHTFYSTPRSSASRSTSTAACSARSTTSTDSA